MLTQHAPIRLIDPCIGSEEIEAVRRVLESGQLAQGPQVAAFEHEFAATIGVAHAVALNSGTAAIHAALDALEIGPGDEVVTTPFTFAASASPVLMQGGEVRFADIDPRTFNLSPRDLSGVVGANTKAVIPVDLFGLPAEIPYDALLSARGIKVIDDACQAIGASLGGRQVGSRGAAGTFSFYATKNIMTGEGGMLVSSDAEIARRAKRFRQHGMTEQYQYETLGYNYRMTDLTAALGRVQLRRLAEVGERRRANAARLNELLDDLPGVTTPYAPAGAMHVYHQYSILIDPDQTPNGADRDAVRRYLSDRSIGCAVYYPKPLHLHTLFAASGYGPGDFPVAERIAGRILALPVHPRLSSAQIETVGRAVRSAVTA